MSVPEKPKLERPRTPSLGELRSESKFESVTLLDRNEMLGRLRKMYAPETLPVAERLLFPHLLSHAGTKVTVPYISTIIAGALGAVRGNKNIRGELHQYVQLVDAMVDGDEARGRAKELLLSALNG